LVQPENVTEPTVPSYFVTARFRLENPQTTLSPVPAAENPVQSGFEGSEDLIRVEVAPGEWVTTKDNKTAEELIQIQKKNIQQIEGDFKQSISNFKSCFLKSKLRSHLSGVYNLAQIALS
jgi:hypothetical protein